MIESAISDLAPSPWWPCPECGGQEFKCVVMFERGQWQEYGDEWHPFDPPDGKPTSISLSDAQCADCGTVTNLHEHYGWPLVGEE